MKKREKGCNFCRNAKIYGLHAVKIECPIKGIEMYGYTGKNEYRENAKNCKNFLCHTYLLKENIEWI